MVDRFYAKVRLDSGIGPIFNAVATTGPITSPSTTKDCGSERTLIAAAHHHF